MTTSLVLVFGVWLSAQAPVDAGSTSPGIEAPPAGPAADAPDSEAPVPTEPEPTREPVVADPPSALDLAEQKLDEGAALARGTFAAERTRLSSLLGRAADLLADDGDIKAAAVAADASWQLDGRPLRPRASLLLGRYAESLSDSDPPAARAIAERAILADPDNAAARALATSLTGTDSWDNGHLTLGGGVGLAVLSSAAFVYGFDVERRARGAVHDRAEIDALLLQRGIAAGVGWPAAVGAVVATGLGLALIMSHDPGPVAVLPSPFTALPDDEDAPGLPLDPGDEP